jgi:hypothetical protein
VRFVSSRSIDAMDDAAHWTAVEPDGSTPSGELAVAGESEIVGYGRDRHSMRIAATPEADGHAVRRTLAPIDLAGDAELRLSIRAGAGATPARPVFLFQLRLGSASRPLADPANTWHRFLPIHTPRDWETVRISLDDLALGGPLTELELHCVAGGTSFVAYVDDLIAVRPEPFADADRGLIDRLGDIVLGGTPVAVAVRAADEPAPGGPALDIVHFDVRYAAHRVLDVRRPCDYTLHSHRLVQPGDAYDIDYAVTPVAMDRAQQSALLEAVLGRLGPVDELTVDGVSLPIELVHLRGTDRIGGAPGPVPVLLYRVGVRMSPPAGLSVPSVQNVSVHAEQLEVG